MRPKVPAKCLACGAPYKGGSAAPGEFMQPPKEPFVTGPHVHYTCGSFVQLGRYAGNKEGLGWWIYFESCEMPQQEEVNNDE